MKGGERFDQWQHYKSSYFRLIICAGQQGLSFVLILKFSFLHTPSAPEGVLNTLLIEMFRRGVPSRR
jgi:hypothetical protein